MRTYVLLLALLFCGSTPLLLGNSPCTGDRAPSLNCPEEVGDIYSSRTIPADLRKNANSVVRLDEQHLTVNDPNSGVVHEHRVVTLLNDNHDRENRIVIYYKDDTKVTNFRAYVYDANGQRVKAANKGDMNDVRVGDGFDGDSRVLTVTLEHKSYPFTIEYEYDMKVKNFGLMMVQPRWQPVDYNQSLQGGVLTAEVPADNSLNYRSNQLAEPSITTEDGKKLYVWTAENIEALSYEEEAPPTSRTLPFLTANLAKFEIDGYTGSFSSWKAYGDFMNRLADDRQAMPEDLKALVRETTAGLTTDLEKIDALYRLLQRRTRYVSIQLGLGGWQPFSPEFVEEKGYGDCKALSNYMKGMLREVGIESYLVVVNWSDREWFEKEPDFANSIFNHMILYVPSEEMYLECTSSDAPTGYLGYGKHDRNVLWLTPEGGKLVRTPPALPADNGYTRTTTLTVAENGEAGFDLHTAYYGAAHEPFRGLLAQEQDRKRQLELLNTNGYLPDVRGEYALTVADDRPVTELAYVTKLPAYARKMGTRMFLPVNKYNAYDWVPEQLEERHLPVSSTTSRFMVDTINLVLPETLEVESLGDTETTITHDAGEYRARVTTQGNRITWIRTLKLVPVELPAEGYADYRQFFVDVSKAEKRKVVLRTRKTK